MDITDRAKNNIVCAETEALEVGAFLDIEITNNKEGNNERKIIDCLYIFFASI